MSASGAAGENAVEECELHAVAKEDIGDDESEDAEAKVPDGILKWCRRLGAAEGAVESWGVVHVKPQVALGTYVVAEMIGGTVRVVEYFVGLTEKTPTWLRILGYCITLIDFIQFACFWRRGLPYGSSKLWMILFTVVMCCLLPTCIMLFIGPEEQMPFQSRIALTVFATTTCLTDEIAGKCGAIKFDCPPQPYSTLLLPFSKSVLVSVRMVDSLTDLSVVSIVLAKSREGCWWFGEPGQCDQLRRLAGAVAVCAIADVLFSVAFSIVAETKSQNPRAYRMVLTLHISCFLCELGVVACTMVSLLAGGDEGTAGASGRSSELAMSIISILTTFASFIISMIGPARVLKAARNTINRVSVVRGLSCGGALQPQEYKASTVAPQPNLDVIKPSLDS